MLEDDKMLNVDEVYYAVYNVMFGSKLVEQELPITDTKLTFTNSYYYSINCRLL